MVFAKEFFNLVDEHSMGEVSLDQIIKPLAVLGLDVNK
jgi:hypothetical protein